MKISELKKTKIVVGNPLSAADTAESGVIRAVDNLFRCEFLTEDFANPEDWINGTCKDKDFFPRFYKEREELHLKTVFLNEIEKKKISRMYVQRLARVKDFGAQCYAYYQQFTKVVDEFTLDLHDSTFSGFKFNREQVKQKHQRGLTANEKMYIDLLDEFRQKAKEVRDFERQNMAIVSPFRNLERYFKHDLSELQEDVFLFNSDKNNEYFPPIFNHFNN